MRKPPILEASDHHLENDFYIVELDAHHGGVRRIFDKELQVELLDTSEHYGNELYYPGDPRVSSTDARAEVQLVENGPLRITTRVRSRVGDAPYECAISLSADVRRVDFALDIDYGRGVEYGEHRLSLDIPHFPDMTGAKVVLKDGTGLSTLFPLAFSGKLFINQPFGVYETEKKDQFSLDFADVHQGDYGIGLLHRNTPGYHYDGRILALHLAQGRPLVVGKQSYRYSVHSHRGDPVAAHVFRAAQNASTPFDAVWTKELSGRLPQEGSFVSIDHENVVLSSMYAEGDSIFVRFYESDGDASSVRVEMPWIQSGEFLKVQLDNQPVHPVVFADGALELDFAPWEIVTVEMRKVEVLA
ncbi:glycoside hydrolase family 38 C-terminal domain-containing protein [Microbacterium phyllosphaerae]|uniref:glycoside hydrolase family 38 C-terminal domain-containing protein n=1 Tax=Microbacterium phyllosphaerae TaxID=124798 RepID=UPI003D64FF54